jgi:hypothetical protein
MECPDCNQQQQIPDVFHRLYPFSGSYRVRYLAAANLPATVKTQDRGKVAHALEIFFASDDP